MILPPRKRHAPPSEEADEAPGLLKDQHVDVERDIPTGENEPVERTPPDVPTSPPAFEE
jgi:hypothetical protein